MSVAVRVPDYTFAFNNIKFSDRILKIEILPQVHNSGTDARNLKRRREDLLSETSNETTQSNDSSCSKDGSIELQTKTLHISTLILVEKSPFFDKLFSNGMRESNQSDVILRIHASEETALMELLNFMYSNTLTTYTPSSLVDLLKVADKYEVEACMSYCTKLLHNLPMTCESALLYLDLPSTISTFTPLIDAAKHFIVERFKELTAYKEEMLNLPIAGIEVVLSSDELQVYSEDDVYDFVVKWAQNNYPNTKKRRTIMSTRLCHLIRFPYMTTRKLRSALEDNDFNYEYKHKYIFDALFFKTENAYQRRLLEAEGKTSHSRFVERSYEDRPIKVVELELPFPQCVVYFDLKKEECANFFPSSGVYSQNFHVGPHGFFLEADCCSHIAYHYFGFYLYSKEILEESLVVDYEFAARINTTKEFKILTKSTHSFTDTDGCGNGDLFGMPWENLMADDSIYFINGVLHLRATVILKQ